MILGIDPGPEVCGVVLYDHHHRSVVESWPAMPVHLTLALLADISTERLVVAIERVQSAGISGAHLLLTSEVVGRLWQAAEARGLPVRLLYRRDVCSRLHVHGSGKDRQVRERMIESHGGIRSAAIGSKRTPGPLYGVSSHAWQALGLAVVVAEMEAE